MIIDDTKWKRQKKLIVQKNIGCCRPFWSPQQPDITTKRQGFPWRNKRKSEQARTCSDVGSKTSADLQRKSRIDVETHSVSPDYQSAHALCNPALKTCHRHLFDVQARTRGKPRAVSSSLTTPAKQKRHPSGVFFCLVWSNWTWTHYRTRFSACPCLHVKKVPVARF